MGAAISAKDYRAKQPSGRAFLRAAEYVPPTEKPDEEYPFFLTTGRVVYHFHTRTKTGRSEELRDAAPDAFIQMNEDDARRLGIADGEMVRVTSRRGAAEAPARIGDIGPVTLFMPFHYGYWDDPGRARAANELTLYEWDAVSKQPHFKYAAVKLEQAEGEPGRARQSSLDRPPTVGLWPAARPARFVADGERERGLRGRAHPGARALGDRELEKDLRTVESRNERQRTWLLTRIRQAAPQTLAVPSSRGEVYD